MKPHSSHKQILTLQLSRSTAFSDAVPTSIGIVAGRCFALHAGTKDAVVSQQTIRRADGRVHWSGIGWDDSLTEDTYRIENTVDFVFDETEYEHVLLDARKWALTRARHRWSNEG